MSKSSGKMHKGIKALIIIGIVIVTLIVGYFVAVYSDIPFIKKWRTIYIETAMSTLSHQWLATELLPADKIDEVMQEAEKQQQQATVDESIVVIPRRAKIWLGHPLGLSEEQKQNSEILKGYPEIDHETLPQNISYENVVLTEENNIKTIHGDDVYLIDTENGITIVNITGEGFVGKLAIIKDPSRVKLATTSKSYEGETVAKIAKNYNAVLAINASGFVDPNGTGNGGQPIGLVKSFGTLHQDEIGGWYWIKAGFDDDDNFRIGTNVKVSTLRDACQFNPALIANGEQKIFGSAGIGIHPRSAIGQTADKEVVFLIIDGRQIGYSIGATVGDVAEIMLKYGVVNAINLDGGASAAMVYKGETITIPSEWDGPHKNPDGRRVPDAWIVTPIED